MADSPASASFHESILNNDQHLPPPPAKHYTMDYEIGAGNGGGRPTAAVEPSRIELWRAQFDHFKTASRFRRVLLSCVVEVTAVFMYSYFTFCAAFGVVFATPGTVPNLAMVVLCSSIVCMLSVWLCLSVCMPSTRGYFHPCFTLLACLTGLCKWSEAPVYIGAQTFGAFLSSCAAIATYWSSIQPLWAQVQAGTLPPEMIWSASGIVDVVANFRPVELSWNYIVMSQTLECAVISLVVCASLDSTNPFSSPGIAPVLVGAMFGLGQLSLSSAYENNNPALFLGGRLACAAIFGHEGRCFPGAGTANMLLGPFLGYNLGFLFYFAILADTRRPPAHQIVRQAEEESQALARAAQVVAAEARALKEEQQRFMSASGAEWRRRGSPFDAQGQLLPSAEQRVGDYQHYEPQRQERRGISRASLRTVGGGRSDVDGSYSQDYLTKPGTIMSESSSSPRNINEGAHTVYISRTSSKEVMPAAGSATGPTTATGASSAASPPGPHQDQDGTTTTQEYTRPPPLLHPNPHVLHQETVRLSPPISPLTAPASGPAPAPPANGTWISSGFEASTPLASVQAQAQATSTTGGTAHQGGAPAPTPTAEAGALDGPRPGSLSRRSPRGANLVLTTLRE